MPPLLPLGVSCRTDRNMYHGKSANIPCRFQLGSAVRPVKARWLLPAVRCMKDRTVNGTTATQQTSLVEVCMNLLCYQELPPLLLLGVHCRTDTTSQFWSANIPCRQKLKHAVLPVTAKLVTGGCGLQDRQGMIPQLISLADVD